MPMWDNFGDQIGRLATAAAIDPVADHLMFSPGDQTFGERSTLVNVPWMMDFMLNASGPNTAPTASTTAKDTIQTPVPLRAVELYAQCSVIVGAGTAPSFDFYNATDSLSLVDGSATADAVFTIAVSASGVTDSDPNVVDHSSPDEIGFYCVTAATSSIGATWGHLLYCWA